jgi:hypothetical protein
MNEYVALSIVITVAMIPVIIVMGRIIANLSIK